MNLNIKNFDFFSKCDYVSSSSSVHQLHLFLYLASMNLLPTKSICFSADVDISLGVYMQPVFLRNNLSVEREKLSPIKNQIPNETRRGLC